MGIDCWRSGCARRMGEGEAMKTWHKVLVAVAVYEIAAYVYNGWIGPNTSLGFALPLDLIGSVIPQQVSAQ